MPATCRLFFIHDKRIIGELFIVMLYKDIRISDVAKEKEIGLTLDIQCQPYFRGIID